VTGPKKVDGELLATAGATGLASSKMFRRTLVQQVLPTPEQSPPPDVDAGWDTPGQPGDPQVAGPPEGTIDLSDSDVDMSLESNPAPEPSELAPVESNPAPIQSNLAPLLSSPAPIQSNLAPLLSDPSDAEKAQAQPAPPAADEVGPAPERTFSLSDFEGDVSLDNNPALTQSGQILDVPTPLANEPTSPGVLGRRLPLRKSIVLAIASGVGVIALALTVRAFVGRTSASPPSASPVVSATAAPTVSGPPSPPDVPSAAAVPAPADSAASPPKGQPPSPSAPAKHRAPRKRPVSPKRERRQPG
jgi:hypothetical protein